MEKFLDWSSWSGQQGLSIGSLLIQISRSSRLCNAGVQGCSCDGLIRACWFRWWKTSSRENKRMTQKEEWKWLLPTQSAKRHLQDVLPRQARHLAKTSCRCPKDVLNANLKDIFVRHLEDTFVRYIVDVLQKAS